MATTTLRGEQDTGTPVLRGERVAGLLLWRAGPAAALVVAAVSVAAAVLVPLQLWQPLVALPVLAVLLAVAWRLLLWVPARPAPVSAAVLTGAVATGFALWMAWTHGQHVVLRRDGGSYALFAQWLATHHGLPVDASLHAFGGPPALAVPDLTFDSPAYFQVRGAGTVDVVPQFLLGAPALFSLGWWATGGWAGLLLAPAPLGGMALLAAGSFVARTAGARWAPLAVATLALLQPVVLAARTTFSETPALALVLGAGALAVDAVVRDCRRLAWVAGVLVGLAGLVRVDSLREVVLLLPLCALLAVRGSRAGIPLAAGAVAGTAVAAAPAAALSWPYLELNSSSIVPLLAGGAAVLVVSAAGLALARACRWTGPHGPRVRAALPWACGGAVALAWVGFLVRPLLQVDRSDPATPGAVYVGSLQRAQRLPVDAGRTYAEHSLVWVSWYTGWIAIGLAAVTLTGLAVRAGRWWAGPDRPPPGWLVPAGVGLGSTFLALYRPGITPDHPWADRRLVVTVLPTVVLAAVPAVAWAVRRARRRAPAAVLAVTGVVGTAVLLVPPLITTVPVGRAATERGEVTALQAVCRSLAPRDVVVVLGTGAARGSSGRGTNEWPQDLRGPCGVPAASLLAAQADMRAQLDRLAALAAGTGHRLVVLAADEAGAGDVHSGYSAPPPVLQRLAVQARRVTRVVTRESPRWLARPATRTVPLLIEVWTAPWPAAR